MRGVVYFAGACLLLAASTCFATTEGFLTEKVPTIPLLQLQIPHGQWVGTEVFDTNGFILKHKEGPCINSRTRDYLRIALGQKQHPKYVPDNCVVDVEKNTASYAKATEICVPFALVGKAISYYHVHGSISGFSNYTKSTITAKLENGGLLFQHVVVQSRDGKTQVSDHHGFFTRRSNTCAIEHIPNIADMKKEGKHIPSNADLNRIDDRNPIFRKAFGNH